MRSDLPKGMGTYGFAEWYPTAALAGTRRGVTETGCSEKPKVLLPKSKKTG